MADIDLIECQQLLKMLALIWVFKVLSVFKQQILAAFINGLILLAGLFVFAVSHLIDNAVKIGNHVKQIEYDFSLRQFFLTALINGSHISITMASIESRCSWLN